MDRCRGKAAARDNAGGGAAAVRLFSVRLPSCLCCGSIWAVTGRQVRSASRLLAKTDDAHYSGSGCLLI